MRRVADVVGQVESRNNPAALRFESSVHARAPMSDDAIEAIILVNKCSRETARVIWSMSLGEFQIMGFNLYSPNVCGYKKPIAAYLASPPDQEWTFAEFVSRLKVGFTSDDPATVFDDANVRNAFARAYNGPGNVLAYADKIKDAL